MLRDCRNWGKGRQDHFAVVHRTIIVLVPDNDAFVRTNPRCAFLEAIFIEIVEDMRGQAADEFQSVSGCRARTSEINNQRVGFLCIRSAAPHTRNSLLKRIPCIC